jgi:hypothetical protein
VSAGDWAVWVLLCLALAACCYVVGSTAAILLGRYREHRGGEQR